MTMEQRSCSGAEPFRLPGNVPEGLNRGVLVAHQQEFMAWDAGLRAAGLDPGAIALPSRAEAGQAAQRRVERGLRVEMR